MLARLPVHVRVLRSGQAVLTPFDFPNLTTSARTLPGARRALLPKLTEAIANIPVQFRQPLLQEVEAELQTIRVEVPVTEEGEEEPETLTVDVAVVVRRREDADGVIYVARLPLIPGLEVLARSRRAILPRTAHRVVKRISDWSSAAVVSVGEHGETSLETVEVEMPDDEEPAPEAAADAAPSQAPPNPLLEVAVDLVERAARMPGFEVRGDLVDRVIATLCAPERSSLVLVGAHDAGKSALVHEVAARVAAGDVPPGLRGRPVLRITANEVIAGARYTGMWQERGRQLVDLARQTRAVLVMGDPAGIHDAGRWSGSDNNLGRFLRPFMETGEVTIICECTSEEYDASLAAEPAFINALQRVDVPEPSAEETGLILARVARRIEEAQEVTVEADALAAAVELTRRYEPYRGLPGKAVRLLEETLQSVARGALSRDSVVRTFARRTGLPLAILDDAVAMDAAGLRAHFESRVLGQPAATQTMVDLVLTVKAGLNRPGKPLASLLFVGPTGVGKTELAKALAENLFGSPERVIRFDMGEYASADAVQRLVGTAWEPQGDLTSRIRAQPFSLVLLDEIEKANRSVFDALLGLLDEGRLTDAGGHTADFESAIVIMTSNLGAERSGSGSLGFAAREAGETERLTEHYQTEAERFFRPEFLNRLDHVVVFDRLDRATVRRIARREVGRLLLRDGIVRRRLLFEVDDAAIDLLADAGFHPRYGARPLQREIERAVIRPLARLIVERRPRAGDLVRVSAREAEIVVELVRVVEAAPPPAVLPPRPPQPPAGTLTRAAAAAEALADWVEAESSLPAVTSLRSELSTLVEHTQAPEFWDEGARAREVMRRLYELQRVLDDLDRQRERASGLRELARQLQRSRSQARLPQLRDALREVRDRFELVRIEIAGAALGSAAQPALLVVTPVAPGGEEWAAELRRMYAAWAERTGREAVIEDGRVRVDGPSTADLLAGESGLHRRVADDGRIAVARVEVLRPGDAASLNPVGEVARIYDARARHVRDPRTGVRARRPAAVVAEGRIEEFILAALRARAQAGAAATTSRTESP